MAEYIKTGVKQELKICPICKLETLMKLNQKVCPGECATENNKLRQREWRKRRGVRRKAATIIKPAAAEWRELTPITTTLVCLWTSQGNTVEQIADILSRPIEQVEHILGEGMARIQRIKGAI